MRLLLECCIGAVIAIAVSAVYSFVIMPLKFKKRSKTIIKSMVKGEKYESKD